MNEHRSRIAALVNALDQPVFGLIIVGVYAFMEIAGREISGTMQTVLGMVIMYFFRPKTAAPSNSHPTPPNAPPAP